MLTSQGSWIEIENIIQAFFSAAQSDRQCTGSPYVYIQIYLHVTTVNFTEIIGFRKLQLVHSLLVFRISQELLKQYARISKRRVTTNKSRD